MFPLSISVQCLWRSFFTGAVMSTCGMQHMGVLFALDPGLQFMHKERVALYHARQRHMGHCHSHMFMMPLLVAFILHLEHLVKNKSVDEKQVTPIVHSTATTLSALGDSFLGGAVLPLWALVATSCVLWQRPLWAVVWTCCILLFVQIFRILTFFMALARGFAVLNFVRALNLMRWSRCLKCVNALLVLCVVAFLVQSMASMHVDVVHICLGMAWLVCATLLVVCVRVPRLFLVAFMVCTLYLV